MKKRVAALVVCGLFLTQFSGVSANLSSEEALEKLPIEVQKRMKSSKIQTLLTKISSSAERAEKFSSVISDLKTNGKITEVKTLQLLDYLQSVVEKFYYSRAEKYTLKKFKDLTILGPKKLGDITFTLTTPYIDPQGVGIHFSNLKKSNTNGLDFSLTLDSYATLIENNKLIGKQSFVPLSDKSYIDDYRKPSVLCVYESCIAKKKMNIAGKDIFVSTYSIVDGDIEVFRKYIYVFEDKRITLAFSLLRDNEILDFETISKARNNMESEKLTFKNIGLSNENIEKMDAIAKEIFENVHFQTTFTQQEIRKQKIELNKQVRENNEKI